MDTNNQVMKTTPYDLLGEALLPESIQQCVRVLIEDLKEAATPIKQRALMEDIDALNKLRARLMAPHNKLAMDTIRARMRARAGLGATE